MSIDRSAFAPPTRAYCAEGLGHFDPKARRPAPISHSVAVPSLATAPIRHSIHGIPFAAGKAYYGMIRALIDL